METLCDSSPSKLPSWAFDKESKNIFYAFLYAYLRNCYIETVKNSTCYPVAEKIIGNEDLSRRALRCSLTANDIYKIVLTSFYQKGEGLEDHLNDSEEYELSHYLPRVDLVSMLLIMTDEECKTDVYRNGFVAMFETSTVAFFPELKMPTDVTKTLNKYQPYLEGLWHIDSIAIVGLLDSSLVVIDL